MKAIKGFVKKHLRPALAIAGVMAVTLVSACAEGAAGAGGAAGGGVTLDMTAINSAMSSGFNQIVTQAIALLSMILPFVISFFGVKWLCVKGIAWFKQMAK